MASARQRLDGYGRPLPTLADAREQRLRQSPTNQRQQAWLWALLEEQYDALLCRGSFADVTLTFRVRDGSLSGEVDVSVVRHHRREED
jgi:hypothetical protein